ncbi:carbohydrate binding domain-containing protein [Actinotalea sp. K2]|uniref:carbohydrate binding domain-containing protein n=1 Tax=Actinotalea sp. K2 TaxID=2939438 RepID=UPI0020178C84|nr:carbohydrate binding domain-containing protein [Actinotalea sp. K2]MCL3859512.1 family 16 glycosylhydrolase [Actinotalea sp. K2]
MRRSRSIAAGLVPVTALSVGLAMPASAATVSILADFEGSSDAPDGFYAYQGGGGGAGFGVETIADGDPLALDGQVGDNNVLSVGADVPAGAYAGFGENFASAVDASAFDGFQFWMYGTGSGAVLQSELLDGAAATATDSDTSERFDYQFTDDWTGWKLIQIPFTAYQVASDHNPAPDNGVLDLTELYGIIFPVVSTPGPVTWKFDELAWFSGADIAPKVGFATPASSVTEGGTVTVTVRLDIASDTAVTADWATADGTATAGEDYTAATGTVTFEPDVTTATIEVATTQDAIVEGNETFTLTLSDVAGADLGTSTHTVTIRDDDAAEAEPVWDNVRLVEGFDTPGALPVTEDGVTAGHEFFADPTATVSGAVELPPTPAPGDDAGDTTLRLTMTAPSYAGVTQKLGDPGGAWTPQDWSRFDGLSFWFHGTNSGRSLFIDLLDNRNPGSTTDDAERYSVVFTDDSTGWRYVELPFSTFTRKDVGNGAPNDGLNLSAVHGWAIGATAVPTETTWYLEDISLTVPETVIDEYEHADGLPSGTDADGLGLGFQPYSGNGGAVVADVVTDGRTAARPGAEDGNSALGLTLDVPAGTWAGISHAFSSDGVWTPQDWSGSQGVNFWLYGQSTGNVVYVDVVENRAEGSTTDDAERYSASITDDIAGWRFVELSWDDFARKDIGNGAPNDGFTLDEVHGYAIGVAQTDGPTEYLVDRFARWGASLADVPLLVGFDRGVYQGTEGGTATVTVALARASDETVTVDYATLEGTDRTQTEAVPTVAGRDYTPVSGTLTFAPGETEKTFSVELLDDDKFELTKNIQLALAGTTGADLSPFARYASIAIEDDDPRDPNLIEDFETHPGLWRTTGAGLQDIRVLTGDANAYPGQAADEGVGEVTITGGGAEVRRDFAQAQDWSRGEALSFWYRGTGSGEPVTVSLRDDAAPDPGPAGWTSTVYLDDFDAPAGTPVNPDSWSNETGGWGWGNQESQFYTPGSQNVWQDGEGNLEIQLRESTDETLWCSASNVPCGYTSARIATMDKEEFLYGRMEARLKVPSGEGLWPAFWTLGNDFLEVGWPQTGEIDIMEHVEGDNGQPNEAFGTIHGPGYSGGASIDGRVYLPEGESFADDFHTFTVEWEPGRITWFLDGDQYHQVTPADLPGDSEWVFDHPFFLILNLAIGGNFGGTIEEGLELPASYLIDYVKVEQAPDTAERFEASFVDSTEGWRQVAVPFSSFTRSADQPAGAPDNGLTLTTVNGFGLTFDESVTSGTVLLDQIRLGGVPGVDPEDPSTPPPGTPGTGAPGTGAPGTGGSAAGGSAAGDRGVLGATGANLVAALIALALLATGGLLVAQARQRRLDEAVPGEVPLDL